MIEWLTFIVIMALGQFSPGPDMLILTRTALTQGRVAAWITASGVASGLMVHAALVCAGLLIIVGNSTELTVLLTSLAAGYLFWLGWRLITTVNVKNNWQLDNKRSINGPVSKLQLWRNGFLCNILNPKVIIFLASIMTPFLDADHRVGWAWLLWITVWLEGLLLWGMWGSLLQLQILRSWYAEFASKIDICFGLSLWGFSFVLIYSLKHYV